MKILVTGGAGYIGSITVESLLQAGHEVVVFDNLSQGHRQAVCSDAELVIGDLDDRDALETLFCKHPGIESVVHFASRTLVGESMQKPALYLRDNVSQAVNLLETMLRHRAGQFILSSTANLFDQPDQMPITETATLSPGSPYGESKHIIERILNWYERIHGLRFACLRYFNAAGASHRFGEDHDPETHIIPILLGIALGRGDRFTLFGDDYPTPDGTCIRDYIHVLDLAQAHILALDAIARSSRIYNLGTGHGFSNLEVIEQVRQVTGHSIPVERGSRRSGDPPILVASAEKIQSELGWSPRHSDLRSIISNAWEWHLHHPCGYGKG